MFGISNQINVLLLCTNITTNSYSSPWQRKLFVIDIQEVLIHSNILLSSNFNSLMQHCNLLKFTKADKILGHGSQWFSPLMNGLTPGKKCGCRLRFGLSFSKLQHLWRRKYSKTPLLYFFNLSLARVSTIKLLVFPARCLWLKVSHMLFKKS